MLGGYDVTKYALTDDLHWHDVDGGNQAYYWKVKLQKFALHFGGSDETLEFNDDDKDVSVQDKLEDKVIFDSGTSFVFMPPSSGNWF